MPLGISQSVKLVIARSDRSRERNHWVTEMGVVFSVRKVADRHGLSAPDDNPINGGASRLFYKLNTLIFAQAHNESNGLVYLLLVLESTFPISFPIRETEIA